MRSLVVCIVVLPSCVVFANDNLKMGPISVNPNGALISPSLHQSIYPQLWQSSEQQLSISLSEKISHHFFEKLPLIEFTPQSQLHLSYNKVSLSPVEGIDWQHSESFLHYLHIGEKVSLTPENNTWLYSGVGMTYFELNEQSSAFNAAMSVNVGLSTTFELSESSSITFDSKLYGTFADNLSEDMCLNYQCQMDGKNDIWVQKHISLQFQFEF